MIRIAPLLLLLLSLPARAQTVEYIHTDALGSPIAVTDQAGNVIERTVYGPYGDVVSGTTKGGPGYSGHVLDVLTGLNYMQQRYYDPQIGRFLSVDPVTAEGSSGMNFNRYWYASNNPYSKTDPDGMRDVYIGGGFDKDDSRIVQNFAAAEQKRHPERDIRYFGWHEHEQIRAALEAPRGKDEPLNVVGHSLGGREAVAQANSTNAQITNLVTIDPVGASGNGEKPSNVSTWTNVTAQSTTPADLSDVVAYTGRRLEGVTNVTGADVSQTSSANHGDFSKMIQQAGAMNRINAAYPDKPRK